MLAVDLMFAQPQVLVRSRWFLQTNTYTSQSARGIEEVAGRVGGSPNVPATTL
jgi:hypothetical protein